MRRSIATARGVVGPNDGPGAWRRGPRL